MRIEIVIEEGQVTVSGPQGKQGAEAEQERESATPAAMPPADVMAVAASTGAIDAGPAPSAPGTEGVAAPTINIGTAERSPGAGDGVPASVGLPAGAAPSSVEPPTEVVLETDGESLPDEDEDADEAEEE